MDPSWIIWYRRFAIVSVSLWLLAALGVWQLEEEVGAVSLEPFVPTALLRISTPVTAALPTVPSSVPRSTPKLAAPTPTLPAVATAAPTVEPTTGPVVYSVQTGDTLYSIARRFTVDVGELARVNYLHDPNLLYRGQELIIPVEERPPTQPSAVGAPPSTPVEQAPAPRGSFSSPLLWGANPTGLPSEQISASTSAWPPFSSLPIPPRLTSVALLGVEGNEGNWRTDTIILAMLNPDTGRAGVISIPRDSWVAVPGYGYARLNTVDFLGESSGYPGGGPALLKETIRENFGLPMDAYARVHFDGFIRIIDTLGGIDVTVDCAIADLFPHPTRPDEMVSMDLNPGINHLDGTMALLYSRSRLSTSDFDRSRRQQSVLKAIYAEARSADTVRRLPQLYSDLDETIETDLGLTDILSLARHTLSVEPENVQTLVLKYPLMRDSHTFDGAMVLLPDQPALGQALTAFFEHLSRPPSHSEAQAAQVVIVNQSNDPTWADVAASRVAWAGGTVAAVRQMPAATITTQMVVYNPAKSDTIEALVEAFGLAPGQITIAGPTHPDRASNEDIRIVLGYDFQMCRR